MKRDPVNEKGSGQQKGSRTRKIRVSLPRIKRPAGDRTLILMKLSGSWSTLIIFNNTIANSPDTLPAHCAREAFSSPLPVLR